MLKRPLVILNDTHLGVKRTGGTTPKSAHELRQNLREQLRRSMMTYLEHDLVFNGDMFDTFTVDDELKGFMIALLKDWLSASTGRVWWFRGNHDFSAKGDLRSSSTMIGEIMMLFYPDRFFMPEPELTRCDEHLWVIPHCLNADLFELEINKAIDQLGAGDHLFLHCNFASEFTKHADHSLNLTTEQAYALTSKGVRLILGHEHYKRTMYKEMLYITGNQWPTSIADCLDPNGSKYLHILEVDGSITPVCTWDGSDFVELDIREASKVEAHHKFIRLTGTVESDQHRSSMEVYRKLRQASAAYVITSAVKMAGALKENEEVSLEQIQSFDIQAEILRRLDNKAQREVVQPILEEYKKDA